MLVHELPPAVGAPLKAAEPEPWSRTALIAFRLGFGVAVLSVFHLVGFVSNYLFFDTVRQWFDRSVEPVGNVEFQVARYIGASAIRVVTGSTGTVEQIAQRYRYASCYLVAVLLVALAATLVWSISDRRRRHYETLNPWLRVYARYALALVMMVYAVAKVVPTQFGFMTPGELLRPVGQLNRFWVLWDFMAVSTGYTIFAGLIELLGCVLLFFRRTALLGGLVLAAALTNVFALDIAYTVYGAAMVAGLLIALAIIVLAPYTAPLIQILLLGGTDRMPVEPTASLGRWRYAPVAKVLLLVILISVRVSDAMAQRRSFFGRGQAVYGMFDVERFIRGGVPITPTADDGKTWKRVASDGRYGGGPFLGGGLDLAVQFANGDVRQYSLADDPANRLWTLREASKVIATLRYAVGPDGSVSLDGLIAGEAVQVNLRPVDMQTLPLLRGR